MRAVLAAALCLVVVLPTAASAAQGGAGIARTKPPHIAPLASGPTDEQFERGRQAFEAGHFDKALPVLQSEADRGRPEALVLMGLAYASARGVRKDAAKAEDMLRRAASSGNSEAQARLADLLWNGGLPGPRTTEALELYTKAASGGYLPAQLRLGDIYRIGDGTPVNEAQALWWYVEAGTNGSADAMMAAGRLLIANGSVGPDPRQALDWFSKARTKGLPDATKWLADAHFLSGLDEAKAGRHANALLFFRSCLKLNPKYLRAAYAAAWSLHEMGQPNEALAAINTVIVQDPNWSAAYQRRGWIWQDLRDGDAAIADFSRAAAFEPEWGDPPHNRAFVLQDLGRFEEATTDFLFTLDRKPNDPDAREGFAETLLLSGRTGAALDQADRAVDVSHNRAPIVDARARILMYAGRPDQAAEILAETHRRAPSRLYTLVWLYLARQRAGGAADEELKNLVLRAPTYSPFEWPAPVVDFYLGRISSNELEMRARVAGTPFLRDRNICEANVYSGALLAARGDGESARPLLQTGMRQCPLAYPERSIAQLELASLDHRIVHLPPLPVAAPASQPPSASPSSEPPPPPSSVEPQPPEVSGAPGQAQPEAIAPPSPLAAALQRRLYAGEIEPALDDLSRQASVRPDDPEVQFALGTTRFLAAVEHLTRALYSHGGTLPRDAEMIPFVRLPVPANPSPVSLDYQGMRGMLQVFLDDLALSGEALAKVGDRPVSLPLDLGQVRLDVVQKGPDNLVLFADIVRPVFPGASAPDLAFNFDTGDVYWLRGYTKLLSAMAEFALVYDWKASFDASFHLYFPKAGLPFQSSLAPRRDGDWEGNLADFIAFIHLLHLQPVEPERLPRVREHLLGMIAMSRASWSAILAETDDDREWIPNPRQTGRFPRMQVTGERVAAWQALLTGAEDALEGRILVPHWRLKQGISLKLFFEQPQTFDPVLWATGQGAVPFLQDGPQIGSGDWGQMMRIFGGDFFSYLMWFN
jgi:tetratricopeptide (TPR) repeat protein